MEAGASRPASPFVFGGGAKKRVENESNRGGQVPQRLIKTIYFRLAGIIDII